VRGQKEEQNKGKAKERCGKSVATLHGEMWSRRKAGAEA